MDVSNIAGYIDRREKQINLCGLKAHKTWCFVLYGVIDNKLSTSRKHIYDKRQVVQEFPLITKQVISTVEVATRDILSRLTLPKRFSQFKSADELMGVIKGIPLTDSTNHVQVIYLCIQMLIGYSEEHADVMTEDEGLLFDGLIYILSKGLSQMSILIGIDCPNFDIEVIFHACDY